VVLSLGTAGPREDEVNSSPQPRNNVRITPCSGWAEFRNHIIADQFADGQFRKGKFLFRGQGSDTWTLSSTFDRWYRGPRAGKNEAADSLLAEFALECEFEEMPDALRSNKMAMLGLAQHHGLPTRLLDWSESPYVAAFFAFSGHARRGIDPEGCVAVWVIDSESHVWNEENGCTLVKVPALWNQRIRNQFGRFTYLRAPYDTLEEYVNQFEAGEASLQKYLIHIRDFRLAMSELDAMGLTHARIYPGLEGNARAAEIRVALRRASV
jgi:FRG domain